MLACAYFAYASLAFAQADSTAGLGLRNTENAVRINATPASPSVGDVVRFSAESPLFDLSGSAITWQVNSKTITTGDGAVEADYSIGASDESLDIVLTVQDPVWGQAQSEIVIIPVQLELLFDSPSYVPPFYRGRAMPSAGGTIRLQAIARFPAAKGLLDDGSITYTWSRNGRALGTVSGLGRSSVSLSAPLPGDTDTISVRASANSDTISATASVSIPSSQPIIALYEDHPLFGIMFHNAIAAQAPAGNDMTVAAIPYFATISRLNDSSIRYLWSLNGDSVTASSTKRNTLTVSGNNGPTSVGLRLSHMSNFYIDTEGLWKFLFGTSNTGGAGSAQKSQDIFHSSQQ